MDWKHSQKQIWLALKAEQGYLLYGTQQKSSLLNFLLLLFGLAIPFWLVGAIYDIELFPGFKLFQFPLALPAVAALICRFKESGKAGAMALLKRTYDVRYFRPLVWLFPIVFIYPSIGLIQYWVIRLSGTTVPEPQFSLPILLGYSTVFLMTYGEELGLTGYAIDPVQQRYTALTTGIILGLVQAGYHLPGFIISGYYSPGWIFWHCLYILATRVLFVWVYNNSGKSLFSMSLFHWTFGLFWILWPQDNLQKAVEFYDPRISSVIAIIYAAVVTWLWGAKTLSTYRYTQFKGEPLRG